MRCTRDDRVLTLPISRCGQTTAKRAAGHNWLHCLVRRSFQPRLDLFPGVQEHGEISVRVREPIKSDKVLVCVGQAASFPTTLCPRDPQVGVDALVASAVDGPEAPEKLRRGQNDEARLFLHEGRKHKDPEVGTRALDLLWVVSPPSGCKKTILEQGRPMGGVEVLGELHLQGDRLPVLR
jgi:hypothetical protein